MMSRITYNQENPMSLTINTTQLLSAAFNLAKNNDMLNKSLNRLSSGKRITKPSDDAGGLATDEVIFFTHAQEL